MKGQIAVSLAIVLVVIVALVGIFVIVTYNGLVNAQKRVEGAKADIEAVCQRRLDLIPNLVETVKGYASHESQTLVAVTEARNKAQGVLEEVGKKKVLNKDDLAILAASQSGLMRTLKNLFALVENYPDLKASTNFLALQDQLEGTENRISVARQRYNRAARLYNTKITAFPGNILAPAFGFEEKEYFEAKEEALDPIRVKF